MHEHMRCWRPRAVGTLSMSIPVHTLSPSTHVHTRSTQTHALVQYTQTDALMQHNVDQQKLPHPPPAGHRKSSRAGWRALKQHPLPPPTWLATAKSRLACCSTGCSASTSELVTWPDTGPSEPLVCQDLSACQQPSWGYHCGHVRM